LRLAVPSEFEKVIARRKDLPVFKGELVPIFQGIYSSRIELKERMRTMERLLTTAEKLSALARFLGLTDDDANIWRAWEPVLFNETHDQASGVMTDHVYEDVQRGYDFSQRLAEQVIDQRWNDIVGKIDTRGEGVPVVMFNPLGWERSDVAEVDLGFSGGVRSIGLVDATGHSVPVQILESTAYPAGGIEHARIAFIARDLPAMGWSVYHALVNAADGATAAPVS